MLNGISVTNVVCHATVYQQQVGSQVGIHIPQGIPLADTHFNTPGQIDVLLGAEIFLNILKNQQMKLGTDLPVLQNTEFGWIVSGKVAHSKMENTLSCFLTTETLENQINKFWEIEETPTNRILSPEEADCEDHFANNTERDESGRFIVKLPFKKSTEVLGESFSMAKRRFHYLENKLRSNANLKEQYQDFLHEYLKLGHMKPISSTENIKHCESYYLPHHIIVKDSSLTTKARVVFDGSAPTSTGFSLNDILMVGPTIQEDLISILLRFRLHKNVLTADIEKMYRQVQVHSDDTRFQRILWRDSTNEDIATYELTTVTYGTACAPYLAIKCLFQLAEEEQRNFPIASEVVKRDFYVDDVLTGGNSREDVFELRNQLINLLHRGGFKLRKWLSNDPTLLTDLKETSNDPLLSLDISQTIKTLGLQWNAQKDSIVYRIQSDFNQINLTKRKLLSNIARLFDPLGLLGPIIVTAKVMMQELWQLKSNWDDPVPENIHNRWKIYSEELSDLNKLTIGRHALIENSVDIQIHGFCDASEKAYGACLYLRSTNETGECLMKLICSKSRVVPLKKLSIPRLELCSSVILARLYQTIIKSLNIQISKVYLWSDSIITLCWIKTPSHQLKTFTANRVAEIQKSTDATSWRHISSSDNPADVLSRGCTASQLIHSDSWWHGPNWSTSNENVWPHNESSVHYPETVPELKNHQAIYHTTINTFSLFERYSSLTKLQRVTAYCFIHNSRVNNERLTGPLTVEENNRALLILLRRAQQEVFYSEIQHLKNSESLKANSVLKSLNPFLDPDNLLRVGGRLENSELNFDAKHQIILPAKHKLTALILKNEHERLLHSGTQAVLNSIRIRYWPINGRNQIKKMIHSCHKCFKFNISRRTQNQIMGDLPKHRVQPNRPFLNVGVDYGWPILLRSGNPRKPFITKAYIALFICMVTKAIHLELVSSLSTEAFLSAFRRFTARRGKCTNIYSDNGTNFQGANNELQELQKFLEDDSTINHLTNSMTTEGIQWHFIPPNSPHFGGLWEAGIKRVKFHIKRVIGETKLNYEEMYTLLTQIEACINSRPLTPIHDDPTDLSPLTPSHFLIGSTLTQIPDKILTEVPINRLKRWQLVQQMVQHIWNRWSREYLHHLQQRNKWKDDTTNLSVGDMVIIKEDHTPPLQWKTARVHAVHEGKDGRVRVATVRTASGLLKRSISKLCRLPMEN